MINDYNFDACDIYFDINNSNAIRSSVVLWPCILATFIADGVSQSLLLLDSPRSGQYFPSCEKRDTILTTIGHVAKKFHHSPWTSLNHLSFCLASVFFFQFRSSETLSIIFLHVVLSCELKLKHCIL